MTYLERKAELLADPSVTYWLKGALRAQDERDPVDSLNDALHLSAMMKLKCDDTESAARRHVG